MKVILFCILICLTFGIRAQQTDYAKLRPSVLVTACGVQDSSIVNTSIRNLLALDTSGIIKNMHMY